MSAKNIPRPFLISPDQVSELNQKHGWFEFGDAQGDVSMAFANAAIERYERIRNAAPDLLDALQEAITCGMVPISSVAEGGAAKHSRQVMVADMIRAAIAKATGETP